MPDDIIQLADEFRRAAVRRERKAALRMVEAYGRIWNRLEKHLAALNQEITAARKRGEIVNQLWLFRQRRFGDLLSQVDAELGRFASVAEAVIAKQREIAARNGLNNSTVLATAAAESAGLSVSFNKLPVSAVENMAGFLSNGAPLKTLLDQLPREARQIVERGLIEGVALGRNPRAIASEIKAGLGGNLNRALTISRTEVLRAYRLSSLANFRQNQDIISGYWWRSSRSRRTCAACIALDGTFFPLTQPMRNHPRCRCVMIPGIKGVKPDKGTTWFNKQDAETQREIVGTDVGYQALKSGELALRDFVGLQRSPLWGDAFYQLSVKRALAGEAQFPSQP